MQIKKQQSICEWVGVEPVVPKDGSRLGIAVNTIGKEPINGLRHPENGETNGWYIWCGQELSTADDFFLSICTEHIDKYLPQVKEYLNLPPGYRFLIDGNNYEDVWYDEKLLEV